MFSDLNFSFNICTRWWLSDRTTNNKLKDPIGLDQSRWPIGTLKMTNLLMTLNLWYICVGANRTVTVNQASRASENRQDTSQWGHSQPGLGDLSKPTILTWFLRFSNKLRFSSQLSFISKVIGWSSYKVPDQSYWIGHMILPLYMSIGWLRKILFL